MNISPHFDSEDENNKGLLIFKKLNTLHYELGV
jgi:hypothetical protein